MHSKTILYFIIGILLSDILKGQCEDFIIELPYNSADNTEDPGSTFGEGDDWYNNWMEAQSEDVAYKLTLDEQRTLYIDTCDPLTDFDTMLAIKSSCYDSSSLYEIDDRLGDNVCVGSGTTDTYPATFEGLTLDSGTYYIIVEGFSSAVGSYGIAIGAVPEIIGSSIASDDSYIEILFNDPIYTTNAGTGAANLADFQIDFNQNGGNATDVQISELTNTDGNPLSGGEDSIRININVTGTSSGVETVIITPTDGLSLFNSTGIAVSDSSTVTQQLNDYFPPNVNFFPENDTINPSQDIVIQFNEPIRLINNTDVDSNNIQDLFTLVYADTGTNSIDFVASVDDDNQQFTLNPDLSLQQRRTIEISYSENVFEDFGDNVVSANNMQLIVNDTIFPIIIDDSLGLGQNNQFIFLYFDEGVYTNASGSGGLNTSDFEISNFVGGNATDGSITSMNTIIGTTLNGGETEIRLTLVFDNNPDGTESITIQPSANQVFDDFGNPMNTTVNARTFDLFDELAPSITFAPANNSLIYPNEQFTLTASEPIRLLNNGSITYVDLNNMISIVYTDGNEETIPDSASIDSDTITITIIPYDSLTQNRQLRITLLDSLEDSSNNQIDTYSAEYTVRDIYPPKIYPDFCSIITNNNYIILSFSEGVYTNDNGTGALQISDFSLDFSDNGGNATAATINDLQRPGASGGELAGGEDSIWVQLTITGTPSGIESLTIESATNTSIFDAGGNPLSPSHNISNSMPLNPYPWLNEFLLDDDNSYIDLIFSEGIFSAIDTISPVNIGYFELVSPEDALISALTNTNDSTLLGGEETIRVRISLSNPPATGEERLVIRPYNAISICNSIGNRLGLDTLVTTTLFDRLAPTITAVNIALDTISITASEGMYNIDSAGINKTDFNIEFYKNNEFDSTAAGVEFTNIYYSNGDTTLYGGEQTVKFDWDPIGGPATGTEEITISPASSSAIFDTAGNPMPDTTVSERVFLPDMFPPKFIPGSASISGDNSYVIFTLTEGVYGVSEITAPVEPDDFVVEFVQNGGDVDTATVDYITNSMQFPVVGGDNILRCYLTIQGTPNGHERIYIRAKDNNSVFDLVGNVMDISQVTDTLQLFDQLVPTASPSIEHGSIISSSIASPINITFNEPIQFFEYTISARHYNYLSYITDTTATGFKITLQPPMASLDTITLSIFNLTDNAGLTLLVPLYYDFYTPPLGDYDMNDTVNVEDLTQFVSFWMADSQPLVLGLGPTSGTFPHLVPELDGNYDLDDGMTFIRMWSWSLERFGLEPLVSSNIGIPINWDKLVVDVPMEAIAGQVYLRYNPNQGKVDLQHTAFGNNNFTLKKELVENGEILLEFGLVEPNDDTKIISIKSEIDEPTDATVIYKFFANDHSLIAAGTQKIALVIPTEFRLMQNYPNPFNNTTTIRYAVPEETDIKLEIFDISGRLVETLKSQLHQPGFYDLKWSGRRVASGIYFIKLEAAKTVLTQKMILLK